MTPVLEIEDLTVEFPDRRGTHRAVDAVSLTVSAGEILGLVGESGAGKSTIGAAITGLLEAPGRIAAGRIRLQGEEISTHDPKAMQALRGRRISTIFQDPLTSLNPLFTIEQQLVDTIRVHRPMSRVEAKAEAVRCLGEVGIPDPAARVGMWPHEFSGGMRQRAVIALALCSHPELIIADEPTTALDVSVQAQILDLIRGLARTHGIGVILVTHDMGVIAQTADRVAVMKDGRIVETGETRQVLTAPRHAYSRQLISVVPPVDRRLDRFPTAGLGAQAGDALAWLTQGGGRGSGADLLELSEVGRTYGKRAGLFRKQSGYRALDGIDLKVREGEILGLAGESGSGKSTLARILAGLGAPSDGVVLFDDKPMYAANGRIERQSLRRDIQMVFQDPYSSLNPRMTVGDIIAEPIRHHRLAEPGEVANIVRELLVAVDLPPAAVKRYPHAFSGGQRQRICIARALASKPRFLICDEPTSALDVSIQAQILNLIRDLQSKLGLTVLFISHDLPVLRQVCDRIAVMKEGRIVELAESADLFTAATHPYTRALLSCIPGLDPAHRAAPLTQEQVLG